ncbi:duf544 domain-containing protein [Phlyctema vagabunda]|uniref:Duf544 domain-containing protein n=1 Tax=Phlyctema vagabunda TaxID=108571 RepID=A0ABR4PD53_9HELO
MVSRKPLPHSAHDNNPQPLRSNPPYPTTPASSNGPSFRTEDAQHPPQSTINFEPASNSVWDQEPAYDTSAHQHAAERLRTSAEIPDSLRPGQAPPGYTPKSSQESLTHHQSNNPYTQNPHTIQNSYDGSESSANAWGASAERLEPPSHAPPPPPSGIQDELPSKSLNHQVSDLSMADTNNRTLNHQVSKLSVADQDSPQLNHQVSNLSFSGQNTNPWQPALDEQASTAKARPIPTLQLQDSSDGIWSTPPDRQAPLPGTAASHDHTVAIDSDGEESPAWDEDGPSPVYELPAGQTEESKQLQEGQQAWDGNGFNSQGASTSQSSVHPEDAVRQADGWNIVEHEIVPQSTQQSGIIQADGSEIIARSEEPPEEIAPALPPRRSQDEPPPQPPRPVDSTAGPSLTTSSASAATVEAQKQETYDIKKINWFDITSETNPRTSPILVQNANGPCPLLALVNALTLSTPANIDTALVETLRSREQVSLGLLLDAVFDELMSGRRGDAAQGLPDVGDLYSFLVALHTGMNVNPSFLGPVSLRTKNDIRNSMSHVHPSEREDSIPGTFEETREMKLYSTFSIPLIHGWLPEKESSAYSALSRSARTYEDAQNLMFREEELQDKSQREALSFEDQATLEDITTIKAFLRTSATQLTQHGLNTIATSLAPGGVAILFRNDHFSTLYRHPETLQLLQLVTDMGYAGHQEVVWESLIDVNGENAEFFSGDFRLVGGQMETPTQEQAGENSDWPQGSQGHQAHVSTGSATQDAIPNNLPSNTEQEDADLALALQLQEEEEERHRDEVARRRREAQLSQDYIEQQGSQSQSQSNSIPVSVSRRGGGPNRGRGGRLHPHLSTGRINTAAEVRPAIPPRRQNQNAASRPVDPEAGVDQPPPSYEQAATSPAYDPPLDHPAHPSANPNGRRSSNYSANSVQSTPQPSRMNTAGRGRGGPQSPMQPGRPNAQQASQTPQDGRDRDCIVM